MSLAEAFCRKVCMIWQRLKHLPKHKGIILSSYALSGNVETKDIILPKHKGIILSSYDMLRYILCVQCLQMDSVDCPR